MPVVSFRVTRPELKLLRLKQVEKGLRSVSGYLRASAGLSQTIDWEDDSSQPYEIQAEHIYKQQNLTHELVKELGQRLTRIEKALNLATWHKVQGKPNKVAQKIEVERQATSSAGFMR